VVDYGFEIVGIGECVGAIGVVPGEHFDCCGEFFVERCDETGRLAGLGFDEFDLVCVEGQALDEGFFDLAFGEAVGTLEF